MRKSRRLHPRRFINSFAPIKSAHPASLFPQHTLHSFTKQTGGTQTSDHSSFRTMSITSEPTTLCEWPTKCIWEPKYLCLECPKPSHAFCEYHWWRHAANHTAWRHGSPDPKTAEIQLNQMRELNANKGTLSKADELVRATLEDRFRNHSRVYQFS